MSNELIVITPENALTVLSTKSGTDQLIEEVRERVMNLEGGNMKTASGRKKIRSNAFKATKSKTKLNELIDDQINIVEAGIFVELGLIQDLKDNKKVLKEGLDKIRKDVNEDVDAFEADLKCIEDEKIELERVATVDRDREFATMMYSEYLAQVALGDSILVDWQKAADAKIEADRVIREKKIADDAAHLAHLKAESDARVAIKRIEDEKKLAIQAQKDAELLAEQQVQAAIQAELDAEEAERLRLIAVENENNLRIQQEKHRKIDADNAEKLRIQQEKQRVIDANNAETKRLADIEQAKIDTANQIEADRIAEEKLANDRAIENEQNKAKYQKTMGETKLSIMALGVPEEFAILVAQGLRHGSVDHVGKIQF